MHRGVGFFWAGRFSQSPR